MTHRGLFIVLEGIDHSGKTTQAHELVNHFEKLDFPVKHLRFPDNESAVGKMLRNFLGDGQKLDARTAQLLFSANRAAIAPQIIADLEAGINIVCDRYSYSGIAYGTAGGLDFEWLKNLEKGLPKPDVVLFLNMDVENALKRHEPGTPYDCYENERFQTAVQKVYREKLLAKGWHTIDADESPLGVFQRILIAIGPHDGVTGPVNIQE